MSYTALYRKWRPQSFDEVIGQAHITKTLKNQIMTSRIAHAYLFCGTRGTGKTSTAKLLARAVNCENIIDGEPCNTCDNCKNILENRSMNVTEIDAASNNGVDNIREIIDEVKYPPTQGKYKVYIIDEVHMLSIGAFNALLKTLEEPPAHVIFILATTDPQKLPATILSRCQRYNFMRVNIEDMTESLASHMSKENVNIEPKALRYISKISDGSMRDAYSLLDQCISFYYNEDITLQKVLNIMGAVDNEVFYRLTNSIACKASEACMNIIDEIIIQGRDIKQFVNDFIIHLRNLLIVKASKNTQNILNLSKDTTSDLVNQAETLNFETIIKLIEEFSDLESKLKYSTNERILLEVFLIKACNQTTSKQVNVDDLKNIIGELLKKKQ